MAYYCKLCGAKLGFFGYYSVYAPDNISLCSNCYDDYTSLVEASKKRNEFSAAFDAFTKKHQGKAEYEVLAEYFISLFEKNGNKLKKETVFGPFSDRDYIYFLKSPTGKNLIVYSDRFIFTSRPMPDKDEVFRAGIDDTSVSFSDCIGVKYVDTGNYPSYLHFDINFVNGIADRRVFVDNMHSSMEKIAELESFLKEKIAEYRTAEVKPSEEDNVPAARVTENNGTAPAVSVADELFKLKQLLDMGVLTQDEFDAQKKKLLQM